MAGTAPGVELSGIEGARAFDKVWQTAMPDARITNLHKTATGHVAPASASADRYGAEGYGPSIYIRDPDGNTIELKAPPTVTAAGSRRG